MALVELEQVPESAVAGPGLAALGMSTSLAEALAAAVSRRSGLVLVAGPSRSGVTTTLDALPGPDGRSALDADGADALSALRWRNPDVVRIAALGDREIAAAALDAALDGRLVVAGLAAPSAVAAIVRMRGLEVERFRLAAILSAVVAQRLVQRLCRPCRVPVQAKGSISALLGFDPGSVVFGPGGCHACGGTGFAGRIGVFEAIFPDSALRRLIASGGDEAILARHAFLNAPNLGSAARALVREGVTTPEEAVRVSRS